MKLKKAISIGVLSLSALLALVSCGKKEDSNSGSTDTGTTRLVGIRLNTNLVKTDFYIGEEFSSDKLIVEGNYRNSITGLSTKEVEGYVMDTSAFDNTKPGTYTIYVTFEDNNSVRTADYQVHVKSILDEMETPYIKGIQASGMKLDYKYLDELDSTGLTITGVMSNGEEKAIDLADTKLVKDYSDYNKDKKGNYELRFSYSDTYEFNGHSETRTVSTFLIAKVDATLVGIRLNDSSKLEFEQYTTGDDGTVNTVDTSTWTVTATYENGQTEIIRNKDLVIDYSKGYKSTICKLYELTVSYTWGEVTKSENVSVYISEFIQPDYQLKISDLQNVDKSTVDIEDTNNIFTITQGVTIEAHSKSYGAQYTFSKRLKLNANGTGNDHSIKVSVDNAAGAKIVVYALSSSSAEERPLALVDVNGDEIKSVDVNGTNIQKVEYEVDSNGTYYIYCTAGAVNLYLVQMWNK